MYVLVLMFLFSYGLFMLGGDIMCCFLLLCFYLCFLFHIWYIDFDLYCEVIYGICLLFYFL